jgi:hypothetical protein
MNRQGTFETTTAQRKGLKVLLAFLLATVLLPIVPTGTAQQAYADPVTVISASIDIEEGGSYYLDYSLSNATISIATSDPVYLFGSGVGDATTVIANSNIAIAGWASGINLVIQGVSINNNVSNGNVIDFAGGANTLTLNGMNMIEGLGGGGSGKATVHVPPTASLQVKGNGVLYLYKQGAGAGFGGNTGERNGALTFGTLTAGGPTIFGKGTNQGAVIGTGSNSSTGNAGLVTFNSGEYTLVANATGALIGGGGGNGGAGGGDVYINGGLFNFNVDWSGPAIGGGGYSGGDNTSPGGHVYITGGSIRTFLDYNALFQNDSAYPDNPSATWAPATNYGVNDVAIKATKFNADSQPVYIVPFDTSLLETAASTFDASIDGVPYYSGGTHNYKFIQEDLPKSQQFAITATIANWVENPDTNLYFYVTGEDHELTVNGETFIATWDSETSSFAVAAPVGPVNIIGTYSIIEGGTYTLDPALTNANIYINTTDEVTIQGRGIGEGTNAGVLSGANSLANKYISIVGQVAGIDLTLDDVFINEGNSSNILTLMGADNTLTFVGTSDFESTAAYSVIHVPASAAVNIEGDGTLYMYKSANGAGIGGDSNEGSGTIVWDGPTFFAKASKMGALFGTGGYGGGVPGDIIVKSGEMYLIGNARGAIFGTGASASDLPGNVYLEGGSININVDFSGSAIGNGNSSTVGGKAILTGGSLRIFVDKNAVSSWPGNGIPANGGISFAPITSAKVNAEDVPVYPATFNTELLETAASAFTVSVDEATTPYYQGSLHRYFYLNENLDKYLDERPAITTTPSNWVIDPDPDPNLYLFLTGEDHTLTVNGETFIATWDSETSSFTVAPPVVDPTLWDGVTYDISWYNADDTEFTLTTAAQFAGLAQIVNNKPEASEAGAVVGTNSAIPADDFLGKTVTLATDLDLGGVEVSAAALDNSTTPATWTAPVWTGVEWTPIGSYTSSGLHAAGSENGLYGRPFKGTFDGGFHAISNLNVPYTGTSDDSAAGNSHALFGDLGPAGTVKNVVVASGAVKGARFNGAIVGRNWGTVDSCASYATVYGNGRGGAGGITGVNYDNGPDPYVTNCVSYGLVYNSKNATAGTPSAGGITSTNEGYIVNCLFVGKVGTGGITNYGAITTNNFTSVSNSYYLDDSRLPATAQAGAASKTAAEIKAPSFVALLNGGGDAFNYDSGDVNGGWPLLAGAGGTPYVPVPTFGVTVDTAIANGTVAPDAAEAAEGETVTVTVTPDEGYRLVEGSLKANDGAVALTAGEPGTYTFTMPAEAVAIAASFEASYGAPGSGDFNGDTFTTLDEALLLVQFINNDAFDTLSAGQFAAMDINGDGFLTMADVLLIVQIILNNA